MSYRKVLGASTYTGTLTADDVSATDDILAGDDATVTDLLTAGRIVSNATVNAVTVNASTMYISGITSALVANADSNQVNATALTKSFTMVGTVAGAGDAVGLPATPTEGSIYEVYNGGANDLAVYPGDGDTIDSLSANSPFYIHPQCAQRFLALSTSAWRTLGRGMRRISRGDTSATDLAHGAMTLDGTYVDWDISGIVPPSCYVHGCPIEFTIRLQATAVAEAYIRENGFSNAINQIMCRTQVANDNSGIAYGMTQASTAGIVEYRMPTTTTTSSIRIHAYWVLSS